jgi:hypothetical protein
MQKKKESLSKSQYDLGLKPKLRESERFQKSLSLPQIRLVKPVESAESSKIVNIAFDSPKVPQKKKTYIQSNDYGEYKRVTSTIKFIFNKINVK